MSENREPPALSATSDLPTPAPAPAPEQTPAPTPTSTPAAAPAPAPTPEAAPEPGPIAARFGQLAAQRREAEARAERLERLAAEQSEQLKTALAALAKTQPASAPAATADAVPDRPVRDAFADAESYEAALVSWAGTTAAARMATDLKRAQEEAEAARAERTRAEQEAEATRSREAEEARTARELQSAWESRRAKFIETHPDFKEIAEDNGALPITPAMGHIIVTNENGPEMAYYLAKNQQEAMRIAALTVPGQVFPEGSPWAGLPVPNATAQAFEMGKIAAKLAPPAGEPAPTPTPTPAPAPAVAAPPVVVLPAPPTPLSGASAAATQRTLVEVGNSEGSMEEYAAMRRPQLLAARVPGRVN